MKGKDITAELFHLDDFPPEELRMMEDAPDRLFRKDGKVFMLIGDRVVCCRDDAPGNEFIRAVCQGGLSTTDYPRNRAELFQRLIIDPGFVPEKEAFREFGIPEASAFCAMVFSALLPMEKDLASVFSDMAAREAGDVTVPVNHRTVVLIKNCRDLSLDEAKEYAEAVIGTMETEGIPGISAGIGSIMSDPGLLRISYGEAKQALALGWKYHVDERVFVFSCQTLERIIDSIPTRTKEEIRQSVFCNGSSEILTEEMLDTVRVFFRSDLNLTAAARQLFIHRNTLNYRLDKIKKAFGLDLRTFQDAVVFKLISEFPDRQ